MRSGRAPAYLLACLFTAFGVSAVAAQETFTYSYDGYTAELPVDPQRVFVMDSRTGLDFALSAGFPIIATDWDFDEDNHLEAQLDPAAEKLAFRGEPNAEQVLTYEPDLLVVGQGWWNYWKDNNSFNSGSLPVLVIKDGNNANWRTLLTEQLEAYNLGDRATALLAEYDAAVAAAKPQVAEILAGRKVAITDVWGTDFALQVDTFSTAIAKDLGIDIVTGPAEATDDGYQLYSAENLAPYHDAALIMSLWAEDADSNPMWQRVPAIAAGAHYRMDTVNSWGFALTATDFVHDTVEALAVLKAADAK